MRSQHPSHPKGECARCDKRRDTQRRAMAAKRAAEKAAEEPRFYPLPAGLPEPITDPDDWRNAALCAQVGGDLWHPEKGESTRDAKTVCRACPVTTQCLTYALAMGERFGVWGGHSERERRAIERQRGAA